MGSRTTAAGGNRHHSRYLKGAFEKRAVLT
jgi:hypothetical protein